MSLQDNFDLWAHDPYAPSLCFSVLADEEKEFWAAHNRWPLLSAIYLSMGFNPHAKQKKSGKLLELPIPEKEQVVEFFKRIKLAHAACKNNSLLFDTVAASDTGYGGPTVDREVDAKTFIDWARENFDPNCEMLYEMALKSHKSTAHSKSGRRKGKQADEVKEEITTKAIMELEAGCKCHSPELARYLLRNIPPEFVLPGIIEAQYERHFSIATNNAFKVKGIPLRNEPKSGDPRGKRYCKRPGHSD